MYNLSAVSSDLARFPHVGEIYIDSRRRRWIVASVLACEAFHNSAHAMRYRMTFAAKPAVSEVSL